MKAIKDCEWKVQIIGDEDYGYWWQLLSEPQTIGIDLQEEQKTIELAKDNFLEFAKLNNITKYNFI